MRRLDTIAGGADRLRIGSWRGDPTVALVSPSPGATPSPTGLARALDELRRRGYRSVLTPALTYRALSGLWSGQGYLSDSAWAYVRTKRLERRSASPR